MARKKENCISRNEKIYAEYQTQTAKKTPKGKQLLTYQAIVEKLSSKYFLSELTIERILRQF
jgi:hypothetical protein